MRCARMHAHARAQGRQARDVTCANDHTERTSHHAFAGPARARVCVHVCARVPGMPASQRASAAPRRATATGTTRTLLGICPAHSLGPRSLPWALLLRLPPAGAKKFACILAFDVPVSKEAREIAEEFNVKIFTADIIYHLFDQFTVGL